VEAGAPPFVRAIANELATRLEDPSFVETTRGVRGVIGLRAATTPQRATLLIADRGISLAGGLPRDADLRAIVQLNQSSGDALTLEGEAERPDLARWLGDLLEPPAPAWPEAAARFWSVLRDMPGAPAALLVVTLGTGERRRYGSEDGRAYEIHGASEDLTAVFTGRVPPIEAGFEGRIFVRGSFTELSVLSGAGFAVRYGGMAADG
jgi:hypothetical protein